VDSSSNTCFSAQETIGSTTYNDTLYSMATIAASKFASDVSMDFTPESPTITIQDLPMSGSTGTTLASLTSLYDIPVTSAVQVTSSDDGGLNVTLINFGTFYIPNDATLELNQVLGRSFIGTDDPDTVSYSGVSSGILVNTTSTSSIVQLADYTSVRALVQVLLRPRRLQRL
jgi:hypothetical protein